MQKPALSNGHNPVPFQSYHMLEADPRTSLLPHLPLPPSGQGIAVHEIT